MMEEMNRRSNKILRALVQGNRQNVSQLVTKYSVQERTIKADIKELNITLEEYGLPVISLDSDGYLYFDSDQEIDIHEYERFICDHTFYTYHLSKNERITILAMILLNSNEYVTGDQLKDIVGVSRNTLLHDIQEIKKWMEENQMELAAQVRFGYIVQASEIQIRRSIIKLFKVNADDSDYEIGYHLGAFWNLLLHQMDKIGIYDDVKQLITCQEESMQLFLSDYSFFEAVLELTVIVNRIVSKQTIEKFYSENLPDQQGNEKCEFSRRLLNHFGGRYGFDVPEEEVLHFFECLNGKSYLKDTSHGGSALDERIMIADALYQITACFEIDFYLDFALYDLLIAHMRSAVYRIKTGEVLKNPFKNSLLDAYPEIFEIIRKNIGTLEKNIGGKFSEDEMSFMVLYFASVIEKENAESLKMNRVRVGLVCETGRGTAQFMMAKLHSLDDMIEVVSVSSVHSMRDAQTCDAQMIISTIPIEKMSVPCITVRSAMLSREDLLDIRRLAMEVLDSADCHKTETGPSALKSEDADIYGAFYELLSPERTLVGYEAADWEDAVRKSGELLYQTGIIEKRYIDAMVENIKTYGPYVVICPETALPHADVPDGVIREAASLVQLKTPIYFGNEMNDPVRFVIGMSILNADSINQAIYDLMMIFGNEKIRDTLAGLSDEKEVLKAINALKTIN